MKKFRTVAAVVIMFFAAMAGYFVGAALQEEMGGGIAGGNWRCDTVCGDNRVCLRYLQYG